MDYEWMILNSADPDSVGDDCTYCPVRGVGTCDNRCLDIVWGEPLFPEYMSEKYPEEYKQILKERRK